jgi:hypothetical protein
MSKVRLHDDTFALSGYENIQITDISQIASLDKFDKGELDELIIENVIDYFPVDKAEDALESLTKLVKKGGKIVVIGTDLYEVCKNFSQYNINIRDANKEIFGLTPPTIKKVCFTTPHMVEFLSTVAKLKILKKRMNVFSYSIEAERI